ncbi:MAG: type I secretion C-terminal target domain-containing protein, partial [Betaproteobacteria bacterium]|nr:type I secretion C-terminal target domain-containing protein [Betaproteobacteria bacterium]
GLTSLFAISGDAGSDGLASQTETLSFVFTADGPLATNLTATNGGAISLVLASPTLIEGRDAAGTGDVVFTVQIVDVGAGELQLRLTQLEAINHDAAPGQNETPDLYDEVVSLVLGAQEGTVQLQYEVTRTDNDGDAITVADQVDLITENTSFFSFDDDGPVIAAKTNLVFANDLTPSGTGVFDYSIGSDVRIYSGTNSDFSTITLAGTIGGVAIQNPMVTPSTTVDEDANQATFDISFQYGNGLGTATATGTLVFDKVEGTYTVTLNAPIQSFTKVTTSDQGVTFTGYDEGTANIDNSGQPDVSVAQLGAQFWVRFDGEEGNKPGPGLSAGGNGAFVDGELFAGSDTGVTVSGTAAGVGSDTLQPGEVLNLEFFTFNPQGLAHTADARASTIFFTFDNFGGGAGDDVVVILRLVDPNGILPTTTKAIIVDTGDFYTPGNPPPASFGISIPGSNDAAVIIESNDYNAAGETYVIAGAQIMLSTEGVTGTGVNLNPLTGASGGSTTFQEFEGTPGTANPEADTNDQGEVLKIKSIGFISETATPQNADLTFSFSVLDADGDSTATQNLNVVIDSSSPYTATTTTDTTIEGTSAGETLTGNAGDDILVGGGGADTLIGNAGSDQFKYATTGEGQDTITDFTIGNLDAGMGVVDPNADVLNLQDVLAGVGATIDNAVVANDADTVDGYIYFTVSGTTATLHVDPTGGGNGPALATFSVGADTTASQLLQTLLNNNQIAT